MLSITFGAKGRKGKGYELNDYIYIRIDPLTNEPLGLTVLSYSKILDIREIQFSLWSDLTQQEKELMLMILTKEPMSHFLYLKDSTNPTPVGTFQNPSLQEILAA
jgi:hypothetical protein